MIIIIILLVLVLILVVAIAVLYSITELLLKPDYYKHKTKGHQNRPPQHGLVSELLGNAKISWRISESCAGTGSPKTDLNIEFEDIDIPLLRSKYSSNQSLRGWLVHSSVHTNETPDTICVVSVHGGGRDRRAFLRHLPVFYNNETSVLMFDLEEHGISDGKQRGLGWCTYEPDNVLSVVQHAKNIGFKKIILCGTSFGAGASILAAGLGFHHWKTGTINQPDPKEWIDAVIAENPFIHRKKLMEHLVGNFLGIEHPNYSWKIWIQQLIVSVALWRMQHTYHSNPEDAIALIHKPLLIMHGTDDTIIPHWHSEQLYAMAHNAKYKNLWIVDKGKHTALFNISPQEWEENVLKILNVVKLN